MAEQIAPLRRFAHPMRRRQPRVRATAVMVCVLLLFWGASALAQSSHPQRVLVLHSYHAGYQWTDNIQAGIAKALAHHDPDVYVSVEYMDTKRITTERAFPYLHSYFAAKYAEHPPSVILATDDNAVDFLLRYRDELFPGASIVFCGVNDYRAGHLERQPGYTGVSQRADIGETIATALKLMPGMRRLAIITDATETGRLHNQNAQDALKPYLDRIVVQELAGLRFVGLTATLSPISSGTASLYVGLLRDPDGHTMTVAESMDFIRKATPQPIFGVWDFLLGHHTVGGIVVSGEHQGQAMVGLAVRILAGEQADNIPVVTKSPNAPMFDYLELARHGFSLSKLPAGSIVLNRPLGLWERYRNWLLLTGALFALMMLTIVLLAVNIQRRRRAESQRSTSERRYQDFVEALSVGVLEVDPKGRIVFANQASYVLCGAAAGSLIGMNVLALIENENYRGAGHATQQRGPPAEIWLGAPAHPRRPPRRSSA